MNPKNRPQTEKRYDAILFDFDGVLADTEPLHWRCWREILTPFSIDLTWETFATEFVGKSDRDLVARLAALRDPEAPLFDKIWAEYPRKKEMFGARLLELLPFLPKTLALVGELCADYKLAVVSSSARSEIERALIAANIRQHFQELVCGKEVQNLKPAPDPYLKAIELLGSKRPMAIEDSIPGVASATAAGCEVIRVLNFREVPDRVAEAVALRHADHAPFESRDLP
jgi:HAD superfamily hydrolase (TIGR01509 family)